MRQLNEAVRFLRRHRGHLALAVPGAVLVTMLHELAHAAAVVALGGTVVEWAVVPRNGAWGSVGFQMPLHRSGHLWAVSLAPYALWLSTAALVVAWTWTRPPRTFRAVSTWFVWGIAVPLADVAYAAVPYLLGADNDLRDAFGAPDSQIRVAVGAVLAAGTGAAYAAQRRLYAGDALAPTAFAWVVGLVGVFVAVLTVLAL